MIAMKILPKILNKAEIARELYPNNSAAPVYLSNKLASKNRLQLTLDDKNEIIKLLYTAIDEVKKM